MPRPRRTDLLHFDLDEHGVKLTLRQRTPDGAFHLDCTDGLGGERDRHSTFFHDLEKALEYARAYIATVVQERLQLTPAVINPSALTLGELFDKFRSDRLPLVPGKANCHAYDTLIRTLETILPRTLPVCDFDQDALDTFVAARREGGARRVTRGGGAQILGPVRAGTIANDVERLSCLFNWATRKSLGGGVWLLDGNPLRRLRRPPPEKNPKRPITDERRYQVMLRYADVVDPSGRLKLMLVIARHTGRRSASFVNLRVSDLLLDVEQVRMAIAGWANEDFPTDFADVWVHGAIRFPETCDKMGLHSIVPIGPQMLAAIREYLAKNPTPTLGDAPLFPMERDITRALSPQSAAVLFIKAETAARRAGETLPKLARGIWHPFRRLFRNERKWAKFHDRDVAYIGGWTYTTPDAMNGAYLAYDPQELLDVIAYTPPKGAGKAFRSHARSHTSE